MSRGKPVIRQVAPGEFTFRFQYTDPRTGIRRSVQQRVFGSKLDAEDRRSSLMRARDDGRVDEVLYSTEGQTVEQYMKAWIPRQNAREGIRDTTLLHYADLMERHVLPVLGDLPLEQLAKDDVAGVLDPLREAGLRCTAARTRAVFGLIIQSAVRDRIIDHNPVRATDPVGYKRAPVTPMSSSELGAFLRAARRRPIMGLFFRMSAATGLRPSEQSALTWGDIDTEKGTIGVRRSIRWIGKEYSFYDTKTPNSRRTIRVPEALVEELAEASVGHSSRGLIFQTSNGRPHDPRNLRTYFKGTLKQAGLLPEEDEGDEEEQVREAVVSDDRILEEMGTRSGFRLYDLRHTHASHLLLQRMNPLDVSRRLGHASVAFTLDTYAHVLAEMEDKVAEAAGRILALESEA